MIEQQVLKPPCKGKTLGDMSSLQIAPEETIDSTLFFHRFEVVSKIFELSMQDAMHNELSLFLHTLFEARNIFR